MKQDFNPRYLGDSPARLSQSGQMLGWCVFGALVLVGFFFGIVTGYEPPKKNLVAKAPKDNPKPAEKTDAKGTPDARPATQPNQPEPPKDDNPPKEDPPKKDPPKVDPPKIEVPPKKDDLKKEDLKPVVFKDVLPILRVHCLNCHGAGTGKPKGDVNLTSIANMMKSRGGKSSFPASRTRATFTPASPNARCPTAGGRNRRPTS